MSTTNDEGDKARIWSMDESSQWRNFSSKFRPRCCRDGYTLLPIILSVISIFLALGVIFGVAIRWNQMTQEIQDLRDMYNKISTAPATAAQKVPPPSVRQSVAYIRWGKKTCSGDATLVYSGFGAGSSSSSQTITGGGAQYLCMHTDPEWNKFDLKNDTYAFSWLYGAEILSYEGYGIFDDDIHGHNAACSVCLAPRSTKITIPARRTCPVGWTKEYEGYLMSSYVRDTKMTFECVDGNPDVIGGTQNITGGAQFFFVSPYCGEYGGIAHCPPYINARELTCVVCTK